MRQALACVLIGLALAALAQAQCPAALSSVKGQSENYRWSPSDNGAVQYSLCSFISVTCGSLPDNQCQNTASNCCGVCQTWVDKDNGAQGACLGTKLGTVSAITGGYSILYTGGDPTDSGTGRQVYVQLTCGGSSPTKATSFIQASGPAPPNGAPYSYYLYVQSSAICGGGVGGLVFFIIVICAAFVYFVTFALLNKFKNGAEGLDIIPHREFWVETPSYFIDGVVFVKNKIMGLFGREGYSTIS